jgi:hypothetical protein
MRTGLVWLRIGTGGEISWIRYWTFEFHKPLGNYRVSKQLGISRVMLSSMELVIYTFPRTFSLVTYRVISVLKPSWKVPSILEEKATKFYSQAKVITDNECQLFSLYIFPGCNVAAVNTTTVVMLRTEDGGHPWQGRPWANTLLVNGLKHAGFCPSLFSKQHIHSRIQLLNNVFLHNIQKLGVSTLIQWRIACSKLVPFDRTHF